MVICLDWETLPIVGNPIVHPPKPVGLAVKYDDDVSDYFTDWDQMRTELHNAIESGDDLLMHNAPFDLSVAREWFSCPWPEWSRVHDTMYLIFLNDPYTKHLGLKPAGEELLGIPPDEQAELRDWIIKHVPQSTAKSWGAWIHKAPVELVAPYAKQDTDLTYKLFKHLEHCRGPAYDRERRLVPHLTAATLKGVRVDRQALQHDLEVAQRSHDEGVDRLRKLLNAPDLKPSNGRQLAEALEPTGLVTHWDYTPKSKQKCTKRDVLIKYTKPSPELDLIVYIGAMDTIIGTFMKSWLELSEPDGRLHPTWNQVRANHGKSGFSGARTGRLSCEKPNFQNVPKEFNLTVPEGLTPVPMMRDYLLPEPGQTWGSRDFSAQEIRILAHFECKEGIEGLVGTEAERKGIARATFTPEKQSGGGLLAAFKENPEMDPHQMIADMIKDETGKDVTRKDVKGINFGLIYGMGLHALSAKLGVDEDEAKEMLKAYHAAMPGVGDLIYACKTVGSTNRSLTTWGGRTYFKEPSEFRDMSYKLTNYLIQGSAADQTKECLIRYFENKPEDEHFMATVHDEINISFSDPMSDTLREAMEKPLDGMRAPLRTTFGEGESWGKS